MAAGGFGTTFASGFQLKRKRFDDQNDDSVHQHDLSSFKRRNLTHLPIRSPPRPAIALTSAFGHFPLNPGTLTPDSIPEDDVFRSNSAFHKAISSSRPHSNSNASSNDSLAVHADYSSVDNGDIEMGVSSPKHANKEIPTPSRIGRARSNDLMSPVRSPIVIPPSPSRWAQDRVPTPVASRFSAHSPFASSFALAAARPMHSNMVPTSLSPMVDAESWTPQIRRPSSPQPENELAPAFDEDAMMDMDVSNSNMMSSSFSGLSVHQSDPRLASDFPSVQSTLHSSPTRNNSSQTSWGSQNPSSQYHRGLGLAESDERRMNILDEEAQMSGVHNGGGRGVAYGHTRNQSSTGRTARLHMGFRTDCEKCVARVPGHYSHILWS